MPYGTYDKASIHHSMFDDVYDTDAHFRQGGVIYTDEPCDYRFVAFTVPRKIIRHNAAFCVRKNCPRVEYISIAIKLKHVPASKQSIPQTTERKT